MLYKFFQLLSLETGAGGLFDFGATLPLMAIQFLVLMVVLDSLLYSPLLAIIDERDEFVQENLKKAAELLEQANKIKMSAEEEVSTAEKASQLEIAKYTKESKKSFEGHLSVISLGFDQALDKTTTDLRNKQVNDLKVLKSENEEEITKKILSILLN